MKLELGKIYVKGLKFGNATAVSGGVLTINKDELVQLLQQDDHIKSVSVEFAAPGEKTRITPVKDVIEPRVKVNGAGGIFPGVMNKVETVGEGHPCAFGRGGRYMRTYRGLPGRNHRHVRAGRGIHAVLPNAQYRVDYRACRRFEPIRLRNRS